MRSRWMTASVKAVWKSRSGGPMATEDGGEVPDGREECCGAVCEAGADVLLALVPEGPVEYEERHPGADDCTDEPCDQGGQPGQVWLRGGELRGGHCRILCGGDAVGRHAVSSCPTQPAPP